MFDHAINENLPRQIANNLMDSDRNPAIAFLLECFRIHVGIDHAPLARPILTNTIMAMHGAAFHSIGPMNVRSHGCQGGLDRAPIERVVCAPQQFDVGSLSLHVRFG